ncbi:hypothetical protein [Kitasatospora sp. NBC_01302]|uniref:hypothetical protein n=1 Tax=Kitasatospora sp. NBC_01302 TaxID=2903575 RepID=UPI002E135CE8|nr:hypothetical protein OG294_29730 [Kitasatospora sp. NBC_01302]
MTVPNTPPGAPQGGNPLGISEDLPQGADQGDASGGLPKGAGGLPKDTGDGARGQAPTAAEPAAAQDTPAASDREAAQPVSETPETTAAQPSGRWTGLTRSAHGNRLMDELRVGAPILGACLLLGVLLGALWYWLAPEVPLVVHGQSVLYVDPEGEQRAGADGTFVLLGLAFGLVTAGAAFLRTRQRGGGVVVALALGLGGLAGSLIAWRLGMALGPTTNLIAHAKQVGDGHTFNEALQLSAYGALLAWPFAALLALLALTATFGKREQDPPPYWAGPVLPSAGGPVDELPVPTAAEGEGVSDASDASGAADPSAADAGAAEKPEASPGAGPVVGAQAVGGQGTGTPAGQTVGSPSAPADLGADSTRQPQ